MDCETTFIIYQCSALNKELLQSLNSLHMFSSAISPIKLTQYPQSIGLSNLVITKKSLCDYYEHIPYSPSSLHTINSLETNLHILPTNITSKGNMTIFHSNINLSLSSITIIVATMQSYSHFRKHLNSISRLSIVHT